MVQSFWRIDFYHILVESYSIYFKKQINFITEINNDHILTKYMNERQKLQYLKMYDTHSQKQYEYRIKFFS